MNLEAASAEDGEADELDAGENDRLWTETGSLEEVDWLLDESEAGETREEGVEDVADVKEEAGAEGKVDEGDTAVRVV